MSQIHIYHICTVFKRPRHLIRYTVGHTYDRIVRKGRFVTHMNPPDYPYIREILIDTGHHLIIYATFIKDKSGALIED